VPLCFRQQALSRRKVHPVVNNGYLQRISPTTDIFNHSLSQGIPADHNHPPAKAMQEVSEAERKGHQLAEIKEMFTSEIKEMFTSEIKEMFTSEIKEMFTSAFASMEARRKDDSEMSKAGHSQLQGQIAAVGQDVTSLSG
jgi:hypothetical protein